MKLEVVSEKTKKKIHHTPILFAHGAWHGAWCYQKYFMPYFAQQGFDTYALNYRDHAGSEKTGMRTNRIKDYVADLGQVIDKLPGKPILVAHSMGGHVAQKYLEEQQLPATVLLAPVPTVGVWWIMQYMLTRHPLAFLKANLTLSLYPVVNTPALSKELFFSPNIPEAEFQEYFSKIQDESYFAFWDMLCLNLPHPKRVKGTPILVLGAEHDGIFPRVQEERTARAYNSTAEFFPGMAHDMMVEKDWKKVANRIIAWLKEKGL
jgi:pimeloyl-ACP methyl ester carboxylesterase